MDDDRIDEPDPLQTDLPTANPPRPPPADKPRASFFVDEWDDAPTTNTFRFPRS